MSVRVIVADDQAIIRDGLAFILRGIPEVELIATAQDGEQAVALAHAEHPDVVLMDLRMPGMDGLEATRLIRAQLPGVQVVVLTTYDDDESVFTALRHGARGYLLKDAGAEEIATALRRVDEGRAHLDAGVQARLVDALDEAPVRRTPEAARAGLTAREEEVLRLIADGLSNQQIAEQLVVAEVTVKTHINHAFTKIGARDRAQAVTWAYRNGLTFP